MNLTSFQTLLQNLTTGNPIDHAQAEEYYQNFLSTSPNQLISLHLQNILESNEENNVRRSLVLLKSFMSYNSELFASCFDLNQFFKILIQILETIKFPSCLNLLSYLSFSFVFTYHESDFFSNLQQIFFEKLQSNDPIIIKIY